MVGLSDAMAQPIKLKGRKLSGRIITIIIKMVNIRQGQMIIKIAV